LEILSVETDLLRHGPRWTTPDEQLSSTVDEETTADERGKLGSVGCSSVESSDSGEGAGFLKMAVTVYVRLPSPDS
jgi:hypothetical protein